MRKSVILVAIAAAFTVFYSCKKDSAAVDTSTCSTTVSYATDVAPIITSYCNTSSGCHASGSSHGVFTTYASVYSAKSTIYSEVSTGKMPEGSTLTSTQKMAILCWISNGALNN